MSSTNRGYNRHVSDYYLTPLQPIRDFLSQFLLDEKIDRPDRLIWFDPCSGGDENNLMSYPTVLEQEFDPTIITLDIREDSKAEMKQDYLTYKQPTQPTDRFNPDVIITNPPFYSAKEIVKKALQEVKPQGYVIMLLRLNFWGSKDRNQWLKDNMPKYCYVHGFPRMGFIPSKPSKTDSIEYAHFVWQRDLHPKKTKIILL